MKLLMSSDRSGRRWRQAVPALGGLVLLVGGCQTFEPRPLDLAGHQAAFFERTPDDPQVLQFVEALTAGGTGAQTAAAGFDPTDGLSHDEAELVALVFNADLRLARLRAGVTLATAENAGLWEDPRLGVDLTRILQSTPKPWQFATTLGLTLPISGRLQIEKERAGLEHAAELAEVLGQEWDTRIAVRRAWAQWSALQAQLATLHDFFERIDQVLGLVERMEQAGEITRAEARLFRIERMTMVAELARLEAREREAALALRQWLGLAPDAGASFQPMALGVRGQDQTPPADARTLGRNPALIVTAAAYQVAEKQLQLEIRRQYPDLEIGPGYGREDGQDQVLLGLSLPLPVWNRNRQAIAEARAQRELARATAETTLETLLHTFRAAELRFAAAQQQRRMLEKDLVPQVDALYADAREVARLGEVNTLVLLESLSRQHAVRSQLIEARCEETLARIEVDALLGPPVAAGDEEADLADWADPVDPARERALSLEVN